MELLDWFNLVAYQGPSTIPEDDGLIWYSKYDESYIARVGMEYTAKHLATRDITEQLTDGVGFSPTHNKWFGWSHRAIYGFTIGSTCEPGDCHYVPDTIENFVEDQLIFWDLGPYERWTDCEVPTIKCKHVLDRIKYAPEGVRIKYHSVFVGGFLLRQKIRKSRRNRQAYVRTYLRPVKRGYTVDRFYPQPKLGRGSWTATTMEEAKEMAEDFCKGVS